MSGICSRLLSVLAVPRVGNRGLPERRVKKTRSYHCAAYYMKEMRKAHDTDKLEELLDEAAHMPISVISPDEYEKLFWYCMNKNVL